MHSADRRFLAAALLALFLVLPMSLPAFAR